MTDLDKRRLQAEIEDTAIDIQQKDELLGSLVGTLYPDVVRAEIRELRNKYWDLKDSLRNLK